MCGAKKNSSAQRRVAWGPSPRVRGKEIMDNLMTFLIGTIPACAGQSLQSHVHQPLPRDHPRVCGAKHTMSVHDVLLWGPSPRVRGKVLGV